MKFRNADIVEFELGIGPFHTVDGFPRWLDDQDRGSSGQWCRGEVAAVSSSGDVEVHYENPVTGAQEVWLFSAYGFGASRPGWVRLVVTAEAKCECGAAAVYGDGPHSTWCPRYRPPSPAGDATHP